MPKAKLNMLTVEEIDLQKKVKVMFLNDWTKERIEEATREINETSNKELDEAFIKLDRDFKANMDGVLDRAKRAYEFHVEDTKYDLYKENINHKRQIDDIIFALSSKYIGLVDEEGAKFREKEKDINLKLQKLSDEMEQLENEFESSEEKIKINNDKIKKVHSDMDDQLDGYSMLSNKDKDARDAKIQTLHEDLQEFNQQLEALIGEKEETEAKLKKYNEEYANLEKELDAAFEEYQKNTENLKSDLEVKKNAIAESLKDGQKRRDLEREELGKRDYDEHVLNGMKSEYEYKDARNREYAKEKIENERSQKIKLVTEKLRNESRDIKDRVVNSVELELKLERINSIPKKHGSANTDEFDEMIKAVESARDALGVFDTSKEAEEKVFPACLKAYEKCQNYIAKKDRKFAFLNYFRSDSGKERLLFAQDMMVTLKRVCPYLNASLEADKAIKAEPAEKNVQINHGPRRDVKGELDALKKNYQKNNTKQSNNSNHNNKNVEKAPKKESGNKL